MSDNSFNKGIIGVLHTRYWVNFKSLFFMLIELMKDHFISFFTFPILCKWCETVALLTPNVTLWGGFYSTACNCSLSRLNACLLLPSSLRYLSSLHNFWNLLSTVQSHLDPSSCSVDICRSFRGIVPKMEFLQHKETKVTFCCIHHWGLRYYLIKMNY